MSKEYCEAVECILDIKSNYKFYAHNNRAIDYQCSVIVQALQRLESIDNANPSEALEKLLDGYSKGMAGRSYYDTIKQALVKSQEQEKVLNELIKLVKDLEPTFNRKGVSSDTDILGTIIKDYFYDNASNLLKRWFK